MALVEGRAGAFVVGPEVILRFQQRLQIGGIINRVRPGVRSEELVVVAETLFEIRGQAMVDRAAIGIVGHHVAEGNGDAQSQAVGGQHLLDKRLAERATRLQRQRRK